MSKIVDTQSAKTPANEREVPVAAPAPGSAKNEEFQAALNKTLDLHKGLFERLAK